MARTSRTALTPLLRRLRAAHFDPPDYDVVPVHDVIHALRTRLAGRRDERTRAALARFADTFAVAVTRTGEHRLRAFARANLDALGALVARREHGLRHAAVYALGVSGDLRALGPILANLRDQHHHFDHDFLYMALPRLGPRATRAVYAIAARDPDPRARAVAADALRFCVRPLPYLRRLYPAGAATEDEVYLLCDGYELGVMRDLLPVARSQDPGLRHVALGRALNVAGYHAQHGTVRMPTALRRSWSHVLAELSRDVGGGNAGGALVLIGTLHLVEHTGRLVEAARAPSDDEAHGAILGLGALATLRAHRALEALLDDPQLDRAAFAALQLIADGAQPARAALRRRAIAAALRALRDLPDAYENIRAQLEHALAAERRGRAALFAAAQGDDPALAAAAVQALARHTLHFRRGGRFPRSPGPVMHFASLVARGLNLVARRAYIERTHAELDRWDEIRPGSRRRGRRTRAAS